MVKFSPSGKKVVPSVGPLDAEIVFVAESPAQVELMQGVPLVGPSGTLLNKGLVHVGITRDDCRIINCIPVRAPGDKFMDHAPKDVEWGRELFKEEIAQCSNAKVFVGLGANPTEWLLGGKPPVASYGEGKPREGFISSWRGSVIPVQLLGKHTGIEEEYLSKLDLTPVPKIGAILPTYHPAAVLRQFTWHPWLLMDLQKAALASRTSDKVMKDLLPRRKWYFNDLRALQRLAESDINMLAYDTEMTPAIVGIATDEEVHVFEWNEKYRKALTKLLTSPKILRVAHNWLHDYAFTRKVLEIDIEAPIFDTIGGAQNLNGALQKQLSPHIATRFTNWPYHKWLVNYDQLHYCGMDAVVCYDAYWPMIEQLSNKGLITTAGIVMPGESPKMSIVDFDHKLLMPLMKMQERGFRIDEVARLEVEQELRQKLVDDGKVLATMVEPVIEKEFKKFKKPHLFKVQRKCDCCGGGKTQAIHCSECADGPKQIDRKEKIKLMALELDMTQKAVVESWSKCTKCNGTGKITKNLPFNPDSPDQVADVIYRGLHIRPRKFKGVETVKAAQLDPIRNQHPIINSVIELSNTRAEYDTVARLRAGSDGLLHCETDPWGTESGRVAGKEGLVEEGTNPMNLPKKARRFVIPREGYQFIYPDMAQIEARAMAVLSGDKNLRKALYEVIPDMGKPDYHTWLARAIHDYDSACDISRDQSKRVSYAGFYGARPEQLAKELTAEAFRKGTGQAVSNDMAARILQTLYRVCPEVPRWQSHVCDEVLRTRQLRSPTGRIFNWVGYITDTKSGELDYEIRKQVWSRLPQDMGAYVLGLGLIDLYYNSGEWGKLVTPLIHVHDALLIESPVDRIPEAKTLAVGTLSRYIWGMDFPAEVSKKGVGTNWYEVS